MSLARVQLARWSSRVFSAAALRNIAAGKSDVSLTRALAEISTELAPEATSMQGVIDSLAASLWADYRNEYLYKNAIANKILVGRHSIAAAGFLVEFRIGASVADCVLLNGTSTVYEIKTELDSDSKLRKQLADYRRVFPRAVVVTHHSLASRYERALSSTGVGLMMLTSRGRLSVIAGPEDRHTDLDSSVIMKSLRKAEYGRISEDLVGQRIDLPNTLFFRECLSIASRTDPEVYAALAHRELKRRSVREPRLLTSPALASVRYLSIQVNPNREQALRLLEWLAKDPADVLPISSRQAV